MAGNDMMGIVMIGVLIIGGLFVLNQNGGLTNLLGGDKTGAVAGGDVAPAETPPAEGAEGAEGMEDDQGQGQGMPGMPGMPYPMPPMGGPGPFPPGGPMMSRRMMCMQRFKGSCNKECAFGPNPICAQCMSVCGPPRGGPMPPIGVPRPPLPIPRPPPMNPCARYCFGPSANPALCRRCTDANQTRFGPAIAGARAFRASSGCGCGH